MTTTEFIELIKSCNEGRKAVLNAGYESKEPTYIISETELDKIEKVNVEMLKALNFAKLYIDTVVNSSKAVGKTISKSIQNPINEAIKNANNIKQI